MAHAKLRAVIVADDLTGAMDAAAPFARRGLDVRVLTAPDTLATLLADPPQVLSINTGTRHATAETAAAVVAALVGDLAWLNPELLFKKIDSTLRGHVVVETVAAMQSSGRCEVLICPAVPAQGRVLSGGELFIDGVPLHATAIGRDHRSPPPVAPLPELFRPALSDVPVSLELVGSIQAPVSQPALPRFRIADASTTEQIRDLAVTAAGRCGDILFVGAAGLTDALAEVLFGCEVPVAAPPALSGKALFVVGSRAPQIAKQVAALIVADPCTQVIELTDAQALDSEELQSLISLGPQPASLVLRAPQASLRADSDPDLVAKALADSAVALLAQGEIGLLVVTGGDTVMAVLDVLEVGVVQVCGEVLPGIVHGLIDTPNGLLRLVTKAGGFGDEQLFCTIAKYFQ